MANPYYEFTTPVVAGTTVRSDKYNSDLESIESGFESVDEQLGLRIKLPSDFAGSGQLPSLESSSLVYVNADGDFDFFSMTIFLGHVSDVEGWHSDVSTWRSEVSADKAAAASSAAAAAGYAATVGVPVRVSDGATFNVPESQSQIHIVCLGSATINLPASPGTDAYYIIQSASESEVVTINTNAGANDHQIDLDDGETDYSGTLTGKYQLDLHWLGSGVYRGV
jgi:hypothetical protein